jgi:ribulose-5-phosphate 4-epimerase/fuculose-1-phosphate aldolase
MIDETDLRRSMVALAASLFARGFSVGSAGNLSARTADGGYLITPTNSSLGRLDPERLSRLDADFRHVGGNRPSKEVPMHRAFYRARPEVGAVVHLHSTMATAIACLADLDPERPIPILTPYFAMRIGDRLPVVPYFRPGDPAMEAAVAVEAVTARAVLLANHGPVVSAATLVEAVDAAEELEEAARLALSIADRPVRRPTEAQIAELVGRAPLAPPGASRGRPPEGPDGHRGR